MRIRSVNNIKKVLKVTGLEEREWIELPPDWHKWRDFVCTVINLPVPQNAETFLNS